VKSTRARDGARRCGAHPRSRGGGALALDRL